MTAVSSRLRLSALDPKAFALANFRPNSHTSTTLVPPVDDSIFLLQQDPLEQSADASEAPREIMCLVIFRLIPVLKSVIVTVCDLN
jgi:hypothetical protein